jgi:hypothetical protein
MEVGGILDKLFGRRERRPTPLDEVRTLIERFTTATLAGVDPEDIGRYPTKQRQAMAFHFGAIQHLADEYALDETQALGVFVMFMNRYFRLPVSETGSISQLLEGFQSNPRERDCLEAGLEAFRRWHLQNDRRAPLDLGEMLKRT